MLKSILFVLNIFFCQAVITAQCQELSVTGVMSGNSVVATISNGGDLFFDGGEGQFFVPADVTPYRTTIFAAGLWIGGIDEEQNLKLAAQSYGRNDSEFDFVPGPLHPETGEHYENICANFNKIWLVEKQDILDHISDFADNGIINIPIASIYSWPGHNSAQSFYYNGFILPYSPQKWAPFYDNNNNGNYDPEEGDYPHPDNVIPNLIPEQISWAVFNDNTIHEETEGDPLNVEVQLTSWNFNCIGNHVLKHSLFTSHKIINRSQQNIDSMYVGLWVDFDNGCSLDDFIGCSPQNDGFLVYNSDALDGMSAPNDCAGVTTYAYNPPAQSVAFLNQKLDKFIYFINSAIGTPPPNQNNVEPETPLEYYYYLNGYWTDGLPLVYGEDGNDPLGNGTPTNYAYPDNPNDSLGWSMFTLGAANGDRLAIGSAFVGKLEPGEVFKLDMAHTYHGYSTLNHLGSANQAYIELAEMQQMYDMKFNGWCNDIVAATSEISETEFEVFPNPNNGIVNVKSEELIIDLIEVYDPLGRLVMSNIFEGKKTIQLNISNFPAGIYILKIQSGERVKGTKLLVH